MEPTAKIIVVDDEKRICHNVKKILSKNNYEVTYALSAQEALEKMARDSFSLLISDIVMPGKNGLELLKLVKKEWPLTKAVMMTAYASTDTAVKAIRMGALDYIPKPFTPDEFRAKVEDALSGELLEAETSPEEREAIDTIDTDIPFAADEVSKITGDEYTKMLGRSDMPVVEVTMPEPLENFCDLGNMVCDIFKKMGATCKAGTKTGACPKEKARKKKGKKQAKGFDAKKLIGIDQPFDYEEVISVTGPEYVSNMQHDGVSYLPYEELKAKVARIQDAQSEKIDVDMPFNRQEVAKYTGDDYPEKLSRSDVPIVEITATEPLENFCDLGNMVCDIFKKMGATCKAGTKTGACPKEKAKKKKGAAAAGGFDAKRLIAVDQPFDYKEVLAVTGQSYLKNLHHEDLVVTPYEELKKNVSEMLREQASAAQAKTHRETPRQSAINNILVIDDEVAVNNNIRKILVKKGFPVDQAVTKADALEKIAQTHYKLILLDLKIPGVQGLELLESIRDQQPDSKVIIITGYASIETAVESARMGAVDYLAKPFTPDEIRGVTTKAFQIAA